MSERVGLRLPEDVAAWIREACANPLELVGRELTPSEVVAWLVETCELTPVQVHQAVIRQRA